MVAPTREDWDAAFARLSPEGQATIRGRPMSIETSGSIIDGAIYHMTARGLTQELITPERLDIAAMCSGFNRLFGNGSTRKWSIVNSRSYEQIGTPDGMQTHRVELDWTFRDSNGRTIPLSVMDSGPGVSVWSPRAAIDAEMNQAFALTFLELVVDLGHQSGG